METLTQFISNLSSAENTLIVIAAFAFVLYTSWKIERKLHPDKGEYRLVIPTYMLMSVDTSEVTLVAYTNKRLMEAGFDMYKPIQQTFRADIQSYIYTQSY